MPFMVYPRRTAGRHSLGAGGRSDREELPMAVFSTDLDLSAESILARFVLRWNVEVTFEETRRHLGVETQRQWSDLAIADHARVVRPVFAGVPHGAPSGRALPRPTDSGDGLVSEVRGDLLGRVGHGEPGALGGRVFPTVIGSTRTPPISPRGLGGLAGSTRFHGLNGQSRDKKETKGYSSKRVARDLSPPFLLLMFRKTPLNIAHPFK